MTQQRNINFSAFFFGGRLGSSPESVGVWGFDLSRVPVSSRNWSGVAETEQEDEESSGGSAARPARKVYTCI